MALLFKLRDSGRGDEVWPMSDRAWAPACGPDDEEERRRCVDELETGTTFINAMVASDSRLPFEWREALRLWARTVVPRHPRIRQPQDDVSHRAP